MSTDRWVAKLLAREPDRFDPEAHIPVFHRWIQQKRLPVALIDVADYAHVTDGPGVLLVSHEYNIYADRFDGRPGLTVQRKVRGGAGTESLVDTIRIALLAAAALENEAALPGSSFVAGTLEVTVNDRLNGPNDDAGWKAVEPALREAARRVYGDAAEVARVESEPGARLAARIRGNGDGVDVLLQRIDAGS
jgi:hypothetical protein